MLIALAGLPGVGKTSIARELARAIGAVHLRIDSIEQAILTAGAGLEAMDDAGYRVAYAVAEDNLRVGRTVIGDAVNPLPITRDAWRDVASRAGTPFVEIEFVCSDRTEHRRRVEERLRQGATRPTWADVEARDYRAWNREHLVIDTAGRTIDEIVASVTESI